ncbi:MAG: hypothetical protein PHN84_00135 [Desulfuromonadaceae bacterium]|nr:hypothetical protein [Desulfuromonadaceae bacterium]MDD2854995.1 hypothetical protein [Desulfuromonadaceae bacterium]
MKGLDWNIEQVVASLRRGNEYLSATANRNFSNPHDNIWGNGDKFVEQADLIASNLSVTHRRLFQSVCLASYLLNPSKAPAEAEHWLRSNCNIHDLIGIDSTWEQIVSWKWGRVAIAVADTERKNRDRLFYCLTVCSPSSEMTTVLPVWAQNCMDEDARAAVETALELVKRKFPRVTFFIWPILDQCCYAINGKSLGLPVYLGAFSLATGIVTPDVLSTGAITRAGTIDKVEYLAEKLDIAAKERFIAFIYPAPVNDPLCNAKSTTVEKFAVRTLREAEISWAQNIPSIAIQISSFEYLFYDPCRLIESLPGQTGVMLSVIENCADRISGVISSLLTTGDLKIIDSVDIFTSRVENLTGHPDDQGILMSSAYGAIFDQSLVQSISHYRADVSYRIAMLLAKLKITSGTNEYQEWCEVAKNINRRISFSNLQHKLSEFNIVINGYKKVENFEDLCEIKNEWWFKSESINAIASLSDYFDKVIEYANLPHGWGSGYILDKWINESKVLVHYELAQSTIANILERLNNEKR